MEEPKFVGKQKSHLLEQLALTFIRVFSSKRIARIAYRFSQGLYPGVLSGRRRLGFYLRSLISLNHSAQWFDALHSHGHMRRCIKHEPEMAEKLHRPYRRAGFNTQKRLHAALSHISSVERLGWTAIMAHAYGGSFPIADIVDRNHHLLRLILTRPGQFGKEGELGLHLVDGGVRIYSAAFSFRELNDEMELDIGCIQGPSTEDSRQRVRDLTRNLHGLRPKALILDVLRVLADMAGCQHLRIVGNSNHIYQSLHKRRTISFDYNAFCTEILGAKADGDDWLLPVQTDVRPLSEIPSKKRAETMRRRALLETMGHQIQEQFALAIAKAAPN